MWGVNIIKKMAIVTPLICSIIGCIYILYGNSPWIVIPTNSSFHFNIITVDALFGGFLYTNYSLLIGLLDNNIIEKVKNTEIIYKRNLHILNGIICATISVLAALCIIFGLFSNTYLGPVIYCFTQNAEIAFMLFLIIYFSLSLKEMNELVYTIHHPNQKKSAKDINKLKEKIRNNFKPR